MHIRRIQARDLPDYAILGAKTMWEDGLIQYIFPHRNQNRESFVANFLHRGKKRFYEGQIMFVAVTDADDDADWDGVERFVGYSAWSTTVEKTQQEEKEEVLPAGWLGNGFEVFAWKCREQYIRLFDIDKSIDHARHDTFRRLMKDDTTWDSIPEHWELELLGVDPDYQRRGIATQLLQFGFEQATRDQVPVVVHASLVGEKMYEAVGFKEWNRLDFSETTGITWAAMVWQPPAKVKQ